MLLLPAPISIVLPQTVARLSSTMVYIVPPRGFVGLVATLNGMKHNKSFRMSLQIPKLQYYWCHG